jgi:hypothetical protein
MVDAQTVSIVFAGLSIGIAAIYYALTIRNTQRNQELTLEAQKQALETRQAQLFMNVYNQSFNNPQFLDAMNEFRSIQWNSFDEYLTLFDRTNPKTMDNLLALQILIGFFEGVGVLVKENLLDIRLFALLMTGQTKDFWEKLEPMVEEGREYFNYPRFVSETEYLYNELMKYIEEHPELKT